MGGTRNVGDKTPGRVFHRDTPEYPNIVKDAPFRIETPNGIARGPGSDAAGYGNRKQVSWNAGGKSNRSGE